MSSLMNVNGIPLAAALLAVVPLHAADKVTYEDQVLPIFQQSCLNCHNPDKAKGGLDLSSFSGAMKGSSGGKVVEPGDTGSKLLACVMQTNDKKMPPEGDKLGPEKISLLKAWIEGGLLETKSSTARKASKPKFDTALGSSAAGKPDGPPPMPVDVLLEPAVVASRASAAHAMVASPWAPLLAITGQRQVLLVNTDTLELAGILPFPEGDPVSLSFTPNARYLIVGGGIPGKSGATVTFDVVTGERMLVAAKEFDTVLAADLTPDLSTVATGSPSRLIKMWKAEDGSQIRSIKKHTDWVTALDFSPDGILLATGDRNGGVWVWETGSGNEFQTLRAHQTGITALSFRADSNLLASASEDGTVRFWEMNGGTEVKKIDAHPGGVLSFAWFHDGSFVTSGRDHAIRVWKPDFNLLREIKDQPDIEVAATCDFEAKRIFAADYRGLISVWDLATGNPVGQIDANPPSLATRVEKLHEEIQQQPAALTAAEESATEARSKLEEAKKQVTGFETELSSTNNVHAEAVKRVQDLSQRLEQINQDRGQREQHLKQAREDIAKLTQERDQAQGDRAAAEEKLKAASDDLARLESGLAGVGSELAKTTTALAAANQTLPASEAKATEIDASLAHAREGVAPLEKTLADAAAGLDQQKRRVAALEQQTRRWQAAAMNAESLRSKAEADRQNAEAEALAAEFKTLTQSVADGTAKASQLQQQLAGLEAAHAALTQAQPVDQPAVDNSARAIALGRGELAKVTKEQTSAAAELASAKEKMDQAVPAAKALKDQAEQLKSRYVSLREGK